MTPRERATACYFTIDDKVDATGRLEIIAAIEQAIAAAIEEEREACARLVELSICIGLDDLAKAVRARKSKGD